MDTAAHNKRSEDPTDFPAGVTLAQEEHEQQQRELQLLVAQLELDCQLKHGDALVCAGRPANWFVGFGGYELPSTVSGGVLWHLSTQMSLRRGLPTAGVCSTLGVGPQFFMHNVVLCGGPFCCASA